MNRRSFLKFAGIVAAGLAVAPLKMLATVSRYPIAGAVTGRWSSEVNVQRLTQIGGRIGKCDIDTAWLEAEYRRDYCFNPRDYKGEWRWVNLGTFTHVRIIERGSI